MKKSQDNIVKPRLPITSSILSQICRTLRSGFLGAYEDLVLETAFSLYTRHTLEQGDNYFTLRLKASKTYPFRRGVSRSYFATEHSICPLQPMLSLMQTRMAMAAQPHDPLFITLAGTPLTRAFVIDKLKILLSKLGYNPALYSGHSFRIGAATTAAAANIPDHMIRTLGRWTYDCYCRYIRTSHESLQQAQQAV